MAETGKTPPKSKKDGNAFEPHLRMMESTITAEAKGDRLSSFFRAGRDKKNTPRRNAIEGEESTLYPVNLDLAMYRGAG